MIGTIILALILFLLAWRGWRRGIVRQGLSLFALAVAIWVGSWVNQSGGAPIADFFGVPRVLGSNILAFFLGLVVYFCITVPSAILFKKTHQQIGIIHFVYGVGGAVCGIVWGVFLWGFFFSPTNLPKTWPGKPPLHSANGDSNLAALEQSAGSLYETFYKIGQVVSNQQTMIRFLQYPDIKKVLQTKAVSELMRTPEFSDSVSRGNIIPLLFNAKLYRTLRDPEVEQAIQKVHFKKALDYARG